ncbi:DUF2975 domain-containing protein [Novacetimonas cocois]|uniref:DUF2975 domain-containing protein n=1 Tax=Novacetimonas cocois TaxID=1747507 RepID=A0A365YVE1_9PROT|nr:DUF2975 domain-containing protein [Novacetimonas cocois]RBM06787.1 hypothetical protein NJLHNGOC_09115 [Novacetimonas cocois]
MTNPVALGRFARRLRLAVMAAGFALVLTTLAGVLFPGVAAIRVEAGGLPRPWACAISVVEVALAVAGLAALARMLRAVGDGHVFAPATTGCFRRFALLNLLCAGANIALPPLAQFAIALRARGGHIDLGISDGGLLALLVGVLLFLVARLFDEAARLEEDSRSIV